MGLGKFPEYCPYGGIESDDESPGVSSLVHSFDPSLTSRTRDLSYRRSRGLLHLRSVRDDVVDIPHGRWGFRGLVYNVTRKSRRLTPVEFTIFESPGKRSTKPRPR